MSTDTSNNFTNFITAPQCVYDPDSLTEQVIKCIAYFIIMFASLIGNVLVICVVIMNRQMRTVTNYLIVNMAVADLLITAFSMPVVIKLLVTGHMDWSSGVFSEILCKIISFSHSLSVASSVLSLAAIAVDRFLAIIYPLKRYMTFQKSYGIMAVVWIVGIAISSPFLYALKVTSVEGNWYCVEIWTPAFTEEASKHFTVVLFVAFYVVPLLTISVLYSFVVHKLWVRKVPGNPCVENQLRAQRSNKKVLKMLITVVILFALCWLPVYISQFIFFFDKENFPCGPPAVPVFMGYFLGHTNSAINPAIYFIFNADFRKGFKDLLQCNCNRVVPQRNGVRNRGAAIDQDINNKFIDDIRPLPSARTVRTFPAL
ncbi:QRFP-like peptide receptor [Oculina patagonica]